MVFLSRVNFFRAVCSIWNVRVIINAKEMVGNFNSVFTLISIMKGKIGIVNVLLGIVTDLGSDMQIILSLI